MNEKRIGYIRVSSYEQNPERQLDQIQVDRIFTDKDTQRRELDTFLAFVRDGDTVVVHSMDRLARNLREFKQTTQKSHKNLWPNLIRRA